MTPAPLPTNDADRLRALRAYGVLDTDREQAFDDLALLAASICGTPTAMVSLVDQDRQWFKASVGTPVRETGRDVSFCGHAILDTTRVMEVPDARRDARFADNPLVTGALGVRFYAGAPMVNAEGHALGSLCVVDRAPRKLTEEQHTALEALARQAVSLLELRRGLQERAAAERALREADDRLRVHNRALVELARTVADADGDAHAAFRAINACATATLGVDRAGVWLFEGEEHDPNRALAAHDLYDAPTRAHRAGARFPVADYPKYFAHLRRDETIVSDDAENDPRLTEFLDAYIRPVGIRSALNAPIRVGGRTVGLVSLGHCGAAPRPWAADEVAFADSLTNLAAVALEAAGRRRVEQRYELAARATHDVIWDWDARTGKLAWSGDGCAGFGYRADEVGSTLHWWEARVHPHDRTRVTLSFASATGPGAQTDWSAEYRFRRADGSYAHVSDRGHLVRGADGRPERMVGAMQDLTERHRAARELAGRERFHRATLDALATRIAILDEGGVVLSTNGAWRAFKDQHRPGAAEFRVGGNYLAAFDEEAAAAGEHSARAAEGLRAVLGGARDRFDFEYPFRTGDEGEAMWFALRATRFADEDGGAPRVVVAHEDVTDRRAAEERLRHDSLHDALTGLPNRALFARRVDVCVERARRGGDAARPFAVLFLDLDRFKVVNDSLGHAAGDRLLVALAERLRACVGPGATVARMGGDEFTVLLDGADEAVAEGAATRVLAALGAPVDFDGHELTTTGSVGVIVAGSGATRYESAKDLIRDADTAMYRAKALGKNRSATFDATMHEEAVARLRHESDLRRAVERGELLLHYQPIVSLSDRALVGFEALVRWRRDGRLVSPAEFIPIAEDTGLIVPIGAWVLRAACAQLAEWTRVAEARGLRSTLSMSVNLSRRQLGDAGIVPLVASVLAETGVEPRRVQLEVTESTLIDGDRAREVLTALKALGVRVAIDDFGTGYSSLACLHKFPADVLKIDRAFVANVETRRDAAGVVAAIVSLAHNLGMNVVAEGLETAEQVVFLQALDCDLGQGYHFGKPMPADAAERFVLEPGAALAPPAYRQLIRAAG